MKKSEALHILGLSGSPSADQIKQAHRQKVRENHPDRFSDPERKAAAEERTKLINEARDVLTTGKWEPEYGPRNPGNAPYGSPAGNPFAGSGPFAGNPFATSGAPFGGTGPAGSRGTRGTTYTYVWTSFDPFAARPGAAGSRGATGGFGGFDGFGADPFDLLDALFGFGPRETPAERLEKATRRRARAAGYLSAKLLLATAALVLHAFPVPLVLALVVLSSVVYGIAFETSGLKRLIAIPALLIIGLPLLALVMRGGLPLMGIAALFALIADVRWMRDAQRAYQSARIAAAL